MPSLADTSSYPTYEHCPKVGDPRSYGILSDGQLQEEGPKRFWCLLGQIVDSDISGGRIILGVNDRERKYFKVEFCYNSEVEIDRRDLRVGYVIAVLYAQKHTFRDGSQGLRLENPGHVKVFPCDIYTLLHINDTLDDEFPEEGPQVCDSCAVEAETGKVTLKKCPRCLLVSYCGRECQKNSWTDEHAEECHIFQDVDALRSHPGWQLRKPHRPIDFDAEADPEHDEVCGVKYTFDPTWKEAKLPKVGGLRGTFTIHSGELMWGQHVGLSMALSTKEHDQPPGTHEGALKDDTGPKFRTPAKPGIWKIARVDGFGSSPAIMDGYLAYHSDYDPVSLVTMARPVDSYPRSSQYHDRVAYVTRYAWSIMLTENVGAHAARTFADIDPESGWGPAVERNRRMSTAGKSILEGHQDFDRWEDHQASGAYNTLLIDAAHGPEVMKLLARPSRLGYLRGYGASLVAADDPPDADAFGCYLTYPGTCEWEVARLIFSEEESVKFPGEKDLVAFWYDQPNSYLEKDFSPARGVPIVEDL